MKYTHILEECIKIADERGETYGDYDDNIQRTVDIANSQFGKDYDVGDILTMMISNKLSRNIHKYKEDNFVDCINYMAMYVDWKKSHFKPLEDGSKTLKEWMEEQSPTFSIEDPGYDMFSANDLPITEYTYVLTPETDSGSFGIKITNHLNKTLKEVSDFFIKDFKNQNKSVSKICLSIIQGGKEEDKGIVLIAISGI